MISSILFSAVLAAYASIAISPLCPEEQKPRIRKSVEAFLPKEISLYVTPINRGHCLDFKNHIVEANDAKYLLKLLPLDIKEQDVKKELFMIEEASRLGIGPKVFKISEDAVLMEYIEGPTLIPSAARQNARDIGAALRLLHNQSLENQFAGPAKYLDEAETRYAFIHERSDFKEAKDAVEFIRTHRDQLSPSSVNIHGDLHPQNLFWTAAGLKILDWEWTMQDSRYLDISRCSISLALDKPSEELFLEGYFQRPLTFDEEKEYTLAKKLNFAYMALIGFKVTDQILENDPSSSIDLDAELQEWGFYMEAFSTATKMMPLQFFYDFSRCAAQLY